MRAVKVIPPKPKKLSIYVDADVEALLASLGRGKVNRTVNEAIREYFEARKADPELSLVEQVQKLQQQMEHVMEVIERIEE